MAKFSCPSCGNRCSVSKKDAAKGNKVSCSGCGEQFVIKSKKHKKKLGKSNVAQSDATVSGIPQPATEVAQSDATVSETPLPESDGVQSDASSDATVVGVPNAVSDPPQETVVPQPERKTIADGIGYIPPDLVPGFVIGPLLGEGGMGAVYEARQLSLDRNVALKLLASNLSSVPDFVRRFEKEAKALASLNHPNITSIYDRGVAGGFCYFAMEFVDGETLADRLRERRLSPSEVVLIMLDICNAISFSHGKGIIHRDLKPGNVLIDTEGVVKVTDFGLAGMVGDNKSGPSITKTNMVMGTLNYMAPEQRKDAKSVDHRADIYSLAVMLYEALTGQIPLGSFDMPSYVLKGQVTTAMDEIVLKAMAFSPDNRYDTVEEFAEELRIIQHQLTTALPSRTMQNTVISPAAGLPRDNSGASTIVSGSTRSDSIIASVVGSTIGQNSTPAGKFVFLMFIVVFLLGTAGATKYLLFPQQEQIKLSAEELLAKNIKEAMAEARAIKMEKTPLWSKIPTLLEPYLDESGSHRTEATYLVAKSLVEWGSVNDLTSSAVRDSLHKSLRFLSRLDEKASEYPDVIFYKARANDLLGSHAKALKLYEKCIADGMEVNQSTLAIALIYAFDNGFEKAVDYLSAPNVTGAISSHDGVLRICMGYYQHLFTAINFGKQMKWAKLNFLLERITVSSTVDSRYLLMAAISECLSSPGRLKIEKLRRLLPDLKRPIELSNVPDSQDVSSSAAPLPDSESFVFTENQLRFHALFTLAEAFSRENKYSLSAEIFSIVINNKDFKGTSVFDVKLLNQSRYNVSVLYITRLKSNYGEAISELKKIDSVTASTYSEYELCMGIALFKEMFPSTVLIPAASPSGDMREGLKEPVKRLEKYLQSEPKNYMVAWRLSSIIAQVNHDFPEAETVWKRIIQECEDKSLKDESSYKDQAYLSLARIYAEVPGMMDSADFDLMFSKVSGKAPTGSNELLYWYVSTIAAARPWLTKRDESSLKNVEETLVHVEKQSIGGVDFFRAIVDQKKGAFDEAIEKLIRVSSGYSYWGGYSLAQLSEIYLARVTSAVSVESKTANLDLAEKFLLLLSKRSEENFQVISKDGLKKVRIARAALKNIGDMSIQDLNSALKLERESSRRIPLVLALFEKYGQNSQRLLGIDVLNKEIKREPDNAALQKCRSLSNSCEIKDVVKVQDEPSYAKTLSELIEAVKISIKSGSDTRELEEEFLRLVVPAYSDIAVTWLGRFLKVSPLNERFLELLSVKSEEVGEYDVLVAARQQAVKEAPENVAFLTGLAEAQFEKGREELSSDLKEDGRRTFDGVLKTCRLIRGHGGSTVYEKANSLIVEGKVYRQLIIHDSMADATKKSITAYKRAYEGLKSQSGYQANKLILEAASDLSEIYLRSQAPLEQRKYLQITVKALEELLKDIVGSGKNSSVGSTDEEELGSYCSRYEGAITNLAWNVYRTESFESAVKVIGEAVKNLPEGNITLALLLGSFQMTVRPFPGTSLSQTEFTDLARVLRAAVSSDPSEKRLRSLLAAALIRAGHHEDGLTELDRVETLVQKFAGNKHIASDFQDCLLDFNHEAAILRSEALLGMTRYDEMIKGLSEMKIPSKSSNKWSRSRLIALAAYGMDGSESEKFKESMSLATAEFKTIGEPSLTTKCQYADLMLMNGNSSAVVDLFDDEKSLSNAGKYRLALARFVEREYSEAETLFAEVARSLKADNSPTVASGIPPVHVAYRFAALSALGTGAEGLATEYLSQVLKIAPDDNWSAYFQGRIHFSRQRWTEAQQYGDQMCSALNDNYSAVFLGALIAFEGDRFAVSDLRVDKAIKIAPKRAEAHFLKGLIILKLTSNREKSVEHFIEASKLNANWIVPFEELGHLYLVDQPEVALSWFEKGTSNGATLSSRGSLGKGIALKNMGKGKEALIPLFYALADKTVRAQASTCIGEVLVEVKEPALANKWFALAAGKEPSETVPDVTGAPKSEVPLKQ